MTIEEIRERDALSAETWFKVPAVGACGQAFIDRRALLVENAELRGNLSLAEEGLANYAQETQIQRIDTAPRDVEALFWIRPGTREDGDWYCDTSGNPILANCAPRWYLGKYGSWSSLMRATHWMPLPPEPHTGA